MTAPASELAAIAADGASDATLAQARRERITESLPWFAVGWLGLGFVLRTGLVLHQGLTLGLAATSLGLQAFVLVAAIVWCRADPRAPRVPRIAFAACVALTALATGFFALVGGSVEILVFAVLLICMGSSWAFAWGWRPAAALLAAAGAITLPVAVAVPTIHRFSDPTIILIETALGAGVALVVAEALARSTARTFEQAAAARAAGRRLAAAYEAYRDLADHARDMIFAHDVDGRITYANEAFARAYGAPAAALIGRAADTLVPQDAENPDSRALRVRMAAGEDIPPLVYWVPGPRGRRWLECVASAIHDADGRVIGARGIVRDVTERREAEDALRASLDELRRSEERLRSLARHQASIREDERKRLGFDLHDDVCQELVGIGILIESLRRRAAEAAPGLTEDLARAARYVGEVGEHLRQLARELRPMLLRELGIEESLCSLAEGMSTVETTVTTDVRTPVPRLHEETEIGVYRIAQEALVNAVRHAGARTIEIVLAVASDGLELEIVDDGCGFAPEARRASEALGLVGMEERALALGGRLEVRSAPGAGTRVRLVCPATPRAASAA
ncbi:MAG: PAS domain-containing protein [Deltaproteobacteria bacterium]|nr:PAS domain-containing protein [Deltaproteobacteria bacterium]